MDSIDIDVHKNNSQACKLGAYRLAHRCSDEQRHVRAHQVEAYLGLVPREFSSAERQRKGSITKAGNGRVERENFLGRSRGPLHRERLRPIEPPYAPARRPHHCMSANRRMKNIAEIPWLLPPSCQEPTM
ncbi:MAG: transposase [Acidobacteriota bacterium]